MAAELDIVIPVYHEGRNIVATLAALARADLERFNTALSSRLRHGTPLGAMVKSPMLIKELTMP